MSTWNTQIFIRIRLHFVDTFQSWVKIQHCQRTPYSKNDQRSFAHLKLDFVKSPPPQFSFITPRFWNRFCFCVQVAGPVQRLLQSTTAALLPTDTVPVLPTSCLCGKGQDDEIHPLRVNRFAKCAILLQTRD